MCTFIGGYPCTSCKIIMINCNESIKKVLKTLDGPKTAAWYVHLPLDGFLTTRPHAAPSLYLPVIWWLFGILSFTHASSIKKIIKNDFLNTWNSTGNQAILPLVIHHDKYITFKDMDLTMYTNLSLPNVVQFSAWMHSSFSLRQVASPRPPPPSFRNSRPTSFHCSSSPVQ